MPIGDLITLLSGLIQLADKIYTDYKNHQDADKMKTLLTKTAAFVDANKFKAGDTSDLENEFTTSP